MKTRLLIISHIIAFIMLCFLKDLSHASLVITPTLPVIYCICLMLCPLMGILQMKKSVKALFYIVILFGMCGGIFLCNALLGSVAAVTLLSVISVMLGVLLITYSLPENTKETDHLEARGLTYSRARRQILLPLSYAFFFKYSGILSSIISVYLLLVASPVALDTIISAAFCIVILSFTGTVFYGGLNPHASKLHLSAKSRPVFIWILSLIIVLVSAYIFTGHLYSGKDADLLSALSLSAKILIPGLIGFMAGALGILFGTVLSNFSGKLFLSLFLPFKIVPAAIFSAILFVVFENILPLPLYFSITIPMLLLGSVYAMAHKENIKKYDNLPLLNRKKSVLIPYLHRPNSATLPLLFANCLFASLVVQLVLTDEFYALSSLSRIITSLIFSVIVVSLLGLCILTKEVRHNG